MFGDFVTYAFDQLVNNASKFFHMYHGMMSCPVVVRAPMGGRRGYGPTHSQSLERFLIGIDNCCVLTLSSIIDVAPQLETLLHLKGPAVVIENKIDYAAKTFQAPAGFVVEANDPPFPTIRVRPRHARPDVTIVVYGGSARYFLDRLGEIFERADVVPEVLVLTAIHPIDIGAVVESVSRTGRLMTVEEGATFGAVGGEIIAEVNAVLRGKIRSARLGSKPVPIPSARSLEDATLPSIDEICDMLQLLVEEVR